MIELTQKTCIPCQGGVPALKGAEIDPFVKQLHSDWQVVDEHHLERQFKFADFKQALEFTNKVGELAEQEDHHPDLKLGWGYVEVKIFTHKINGLFESDFILAAKIDQIK